MAVLQAYQADLLKDLDQGQGLSSDAVSELRRTTDLALCATKQTAAAVGRSMVEKVAMERHLWVKLADIREKEKGFCLDALVSLPPPWKLWLESHAFKSCIPRRSDSAPRQPVE